MKYDNWNTIWLTLNGRDNLFEIGTQFGTQNGTHITLPFFYILDMSVLFVLQS